MDEINEIHKASHTTQKHVIVIKTAKCMYYLICHSADSKTEKLYTFMIPIRIEELYNLKEPQVRHFKSVPPLLFYRYKSGNRDKTNEIFNGPFHVQN